MLAGAPLLGDLIHLPTHRQCLRTQLRCDTNVLLRRRRTNFRERRSWRGRRCPPASATSSRSRSSAASCICSDEVHQHQIHQGAAALSQADLQRAEELAGQEGPYCFGDQFMFQIVGGRLYVQYQTTNREQPGVETRSSSGWFPGNEGPGNNEDLWRVMLARILFICSYAPLHHGRRFLCIYASCSVAGWIVWTDARAGVSVLLLTAMQVWRWPRDMCRTFCSCCWMCCAPFLARSVFHLLLANCFQMSMRSFLTVTTPRITPATCAIHPVRVAGSSAKLPWPGCSFSSPNGLLACILLMHRVLAPAPPTAASASVPCC